VGKTSLPIFLATDRCGRSFPGNCFNLQVFFSKNNLTRGGEEVIRGRKGNKVFHLVIMGKITG
jgi:hypothetical protein